MTASTPRQPAPGARPFVVWLVDNLDGVANFVVDERTGLHLDADGSDGTALVGGLVVGDDRIWIDVSSLHVPGPLHVPEDVLGDGVVAPQGLKIKVERRNDGGYTAHSSGAGLPTQQHDFPPRRDHRGARHRPQPRAVRRRVHAAARVDPRARRPGRPRPHGRRRARRRARGRG